MKYLLLLLLIGSVSAIDMDDACSSRGYASTVGVWMYNGTYTEVIDTNIDVIGNARKINWTSPTYIDAVVYKSGTRTYLSDGGYNGSIPKTTLSNDIVFVAFCGVDEVPEFGIFGVVAIFGAFGVFMYRRKS